MNISSIRSIDLRLVDDLVDFVRGPGFVLDFSDASFSEFFATEIKVDIDDPKYSINGQSKGKRLRCFLQASDDSIVVQVLNALWEHRAEHLVRSATKDPVVDAQKRFDGLIQRLSGGAPPKPDKAASTREVEKSRLRQ